MGASIVPFPWKVAKTRSSAGPGQLIIAPDGSSYCQWASCRENLEKSGSMSVEMMDAIEQFLAMGIPGVKVNLGKGKMLAKAESSTSSAKATVDRDWVEDPRLPEGWKVSLTFFFRSLVLHQVCVTDARTWRPVRIFLSEKDNRNFPGIAGVLRCSICCKSSYFSSQISSLIGG